MMQLQSGSASRVACRSGSGAARQQQQQLRAPAVAARNRSLQAQAQAQQQQAVQLPGRPWTPAAHQQQQLQQQPQAPQQRHVRRGPAPLASAAATSSMEVEELVGPSALQPEVFEIITYALKLAWTAETYNVHSWMVLLGLLKKESYTACKVLQELGLDDLYSAWHEVLWALNAADGLTPRAFTPRVAWGERAALIVQGAVRFAGWAGRERVATEDLLMAFAASDVLASLFPDVDLSFPRVRRAVEKAGGVTYALPGDDADALSSTDMFL